MSTHLQNTLQEQISVLSEDEMRLVLSFVSNLRKEKSVSGGEPISAIFEALSSELSLDEWRELPADGAENYHHYLYGAPEKTK